MMNKAVKKIVLKTKKQVYGDMLGNNASLFQGEGFEFAELREYVYGDDVRKIDWKTTAKLSKPFQPHFKPAILSCVLFGHEVHAPHYRFGKGSIILFDIFKCSYPNEINTGVSQSLSRNGGFRRAVGAAADLFEFGQALFAGYPSDK